MLTLVIGAGVTGCSIGDDVEADIEAAKDFTAFPLYWAGERFEGLDVSHVGLGGPAAGIIYGSCTPSGGLEPTCALPLQIQIVPLCFHLDAVALPPRGRMRRIRGAPVGTQDGAPVLLTRRTQIKVYRGEGTDAGMPLRALRALRSLNDVPPQIGPVGSIPPPAPGVLEGTAPCPD